MSQTIFFLTIFIQKKQSLQQITFCVNLLSIPFLLNIKLYTYYQIQRIFQINSKSQLSFYFDKLLADYVISKQQFKRQIENINHNDEYEYSYRISEYWICIKLFDTVN
ncbi:unnamed protein product [Paramecium primaurelia]|uniref:Transmembrane protein n=1 Tax=Paramecium primaurelia TaxID=5886 RepID=A0A8S1P2W4_PARPR|nr:unnamed protein product [Paramecium primaurelia]